jgi:ATP-dependent Clp protease adaptor protein ClpS
MRARNPYSPRVEIFIFLSTRRKRASFHLDQHQNQCQLLSLAAKTTLYMQTITLPRLESSPEIDGDVLVIPAPAEPTSSGSGHRVVLYNDDHTPFDAVIEQIVKATQCTLEKASQVAHEAHFKGRAICYRGAREKCHQVTRVLREIRLQCEVDCDD